MLKKGSTAWLVWNIIEAVLLLAGGILTIAFSGNTNFQSTIVIIVGIIVIVEASLRILLQILMACKAANPQIAKEVTGGAAAVAVELTAGIALITIANHMETAQTIFGFIGLFLGILALVIGTISVIYGISLLATGKIEKTTSVLAMIVGLLCIGLGVFIVVYLANSGNAITPAFVIVGLILIFAAIAIVVTSIPAKKKTDKGEKEKVVDAEVK